MSWAGQTWCEIVQEATYGTFASGGAKLYPVLHGSNAFTMRQVPMRKIIRSADAGNRKRQVVASRRAFTGTLTMPFYPSQAPYIAGMLTLTSNVLPSYSVLFWDSVQAWKFLGLRVASIAISCSAEAEYATVTIAFIGQDRDGTFTVFAQPAQSNYPTDLPYQHVETASNCTLATVALAKYKSLNMTFANVLKPTWDEQAIITDLVYCGRDYSFNFGPQYLTNALRADYSSQSALAFVLGWARSAGSFAFSVNCESSTYLANVADDLPLDGPGYATVSGESFFDLSATTDFAITST